MTRDINNLADILDSRDIIARLEELRDEREALADALSDAETERDDADEGADHAELDRALAEARNALAEWAAENGEELRVLEALEKECEGIDDWLHGATLIRDSYFETYAEELADDIGAIDRNARWPLSCIDWEQAARELQMDYSSVEFDGVTYWVR